MLHSHVSCLSRRLQAIEDDFAYAHTSLLDQRRSENWYFLEGMLSQAWQTWCAFCRDVFLESCLGGQTIGGLITIPNADWTSSERVTYVATCYAKGSSPRPSKISTSFRQEFTWGDINRLLSAVQAMKPTNQSSLLSGFGLSVAGPKHLQIVRNACAHINTENLLSVKKLSIYYKGNRLRHPSELMLWDDTTNKYPAFISWLDDIRTMANVAVK